MPRTALMRNGSAIARGGQALARSDGGSSSCCCDMPPPCPFYYRATMCSPGTCPTPYDIYVCSDGACRGASYNTWMLPTGEIARSGVIQVVGGSETWRVLGEPGTPTSPNVDASYVSMNTGARLEFTLPNTGLRPEPGNTISWLRVALKRGRHRTQWCRVTIKRNGVELFNRLTGTQYPQFIDANLLNLPMPALDGLTMVIEVLAHFPGAGGNVGGESKPDEGLLFSFASLDVLGQRPYKNGETIMTPDGRCFKVDTTQKYCQSPPPPPPDDPVEADGGWTGFPPPDPVTGAVTLFCATNGDDANTGLDRDHPKKTIAGLYAATPPNTGSHLLFRRGDVWNEPFGNWDKWGTPDAWMRVSSYGRGARPVFNCGNSNGFEAHNNPATTPKGNFALTDIALHSQHDGINGTPKGVYLNGRFSNFIVEGHDISGGFYQNVVFEGDTAVPLHNVRERNGVNADAKRLSQDGHPSGNYIQGVDGLLLENMVYDRNGYTGEIMPNPPKFIHNVYIQGHDGTPEDCQNVITRWNLHARSPSSSFQQRPGGVAIGNTGIGNPFHHTLGGGGVPTYGRRIVNVGSRNMPGYSGTGDPDYNPALGVGLQVGGNTSFYLIECINTSGGIGGIRSTGNISGFSTENTVTSLRMTRCIDWDWNQSGSANNGQSLFIGGPFPTTQNPFAVGTLTIEDCSFQKPRGGDLIVMYRDVQTKVFSANHYYTPVVDPFQLPDHNRITYPLWVTATGDNSGPLALRSFPDPDRNTRTYLTSLGIAPGTDADDTFMTLARASQAKGHVDKRFSARAFNDYICAGFGLPPSTQGRLGAWRNCYDGGNLPADLYLPPTLKNQGWLAFFTQIGGEISQWSNAQFVVLSGAFGSHQNGLICGTNWDGSPAVVNPAGPLDHQTGAPIRATFTAGMNHLRALLPGAEIICYIGGPATAGFVDPAAWCQPFIDAGVSVAFDVMGDALPGANTAAVITYLIAHGVKVYMENHTGHTDHYPTIPRMSFEARALLVEAGSYPHASEDIIILASSTYANSLSWIARGWSAAGNTH